MSSVNILGLGSTGLLLATNIACVRSVPPPTLLFAKPSSEHKFVTRCDSSIVYENTQNFKFPSTHRFKVATHGISPAGTVFRDLIVATKCNETATALARYIPNISRETNILFVQDGMGIVEETIRTFWPDVTQRPRLFRGLMTHGAFRNKDFKLAHVARGTLQIAEWGERGSRLDTPPEMITTLMESGMLNCSYTKNSSLVSRLAQRLVVNSVVGPLASIYDCQNGDLVKMKGLKGIMSQIVREACTVLLTSEEIKSAMNQNQAIRQMLVPENMLSVVMSVCESTAAHSSDMRESLKKCLRTDIDYTNGYIVRQGLRHGIECPTNRMMVSMVKERHRLNVLKDASSMRLRV